MCIDYLGRVPAASPAGVFVYIMFCHLLYCDCALELEPISGIDLRSLAIALIVGVTDICSRLKSGAGDGARTRDNLLGRQELYH